MSELYYTYIDETKRTIFNDLLKVNEVEVPEFYSIASITFESNYYKDIVEPKWKAFRQEFRVPDSDCMHFVEYKKLLSHKEEDIFGSEVYSNFLNEREELDVNKVLNFFQYLYDFLQEIDFQLIVTERFRFKESIIDANGQSTKKKVNFDKFFSQDYVCLRAHLNNIIKLFMYDEASGTVNLKRLKQKYTKLRFDGDGKQFQARSELKLAYNHSLSMGTENFPSEVAVSLLDEIRFIRKEEVGSKQEVTHAGLEIIDFLCAIVASQLRFNWFKKNNSTLNDSELENDYLIFEDAESGRKVDFNFLLQEKLKIVDIKEDQFI